MIRRLTLIIFCSYYLKEHLCATVNNTEKIAKILAQYGITDPSSKELLLAHRIVDEIQNTKDEQKRAHDAEMALLKESGHRLVAVVRSRQEYLERELFPMEYISPTSRRVRWWIIFKTAGDPRDEFLRVVENEYRQYEDWKNASLDDILNDFIDFMCKIHPDLSEGVKGTLYESDPYMLEDIHIDDKLQPEIFRIIGLPYVHKNIAGMKAITKQLSMKGSGPKSPTMNSTADLRCIYIFHAYDETFRRGRGMNFKVNDIQKIFPTTTVVSVENIKGAKVYSPGKYTLYTSQSKDRVKVQFENCHDAIHAFNNNHGFIRKDKIKLRLDLC